MNKWEQELWEFKIAELIVESELVVRHKTQESHLPLIFVSSAEEKNKIKNGWWKRMTRDEFMDIANKEVNQILATQKNRMIGLVERAWAEGKKNAEVSGIEDIVKEAIEKIYDNPETKERLPGILPTTLPDAHFEHMIDWGQPDPLAACKTCPNHPSNGGSGICHCILGIPPITC